MKTLLLTRRQFVASLALVPMAVTFARPAASEPKGMPVEVWKDPTCGCCNEWIVHLRKNGFSVTTHDSGNGAARAKAGIGPQYGSCHTALVGGYAIEGHVPAQDIRRLLEQRPKAIGLAVPGMPIGSPGMEMPDRRDPYDVLLVELGGTTRVFRAVRG